MKKRRATRKGGDSKFACGAFHLLIAATLLLLSSCAHRSCAHRKKKIESAEVLPKPRLAVFCRLGGDGWHRVLSQGDDGVVVSTHPLSFSEVWDTDFSPPAPAETRNVSWSDMLLPLPEPDLPCWGYAMTYPGHRREVRLEDSFRFRKGGPAVYMSSDIAYRPNLDYEAEVGVLMNRNTPDRFGYIMVNDLTDRGRQVMTYDEEDPAPGFSAAKSFEGSLRAGPLLAVGNASAWEGLEVFLELNGEARQHLRARECVLRPAPLHKEIFGEENGNGWALVSTGTPEGVVFHSPDLFEKLGLIFESGFSVAKAKREWLSDLKFLRPGDRVTVFSPVLGASSAVVTEPDEER